MYEPLVHIRSCCYGGVFLDLKSQFLGDFSYNVEISSSIVADLISVIKAIELASVRD